MKALRCLGSSMLLLGILSAGAQADSLPLKAGRLDAGPVSVIELTDAQLLTVKTKRIVVLTETQKQLLSHDSGTAPTVLSVYSHAAAVSGIDSDAVYNFAHWFSPRLIEVPHKYLISDEAAEREANNLDGN